MKCGYCGKEISDDSRYCPYCAEDLSLTPEQAREIARQKQELLKQQKSLRKKENKKKKRKGGFLLVVLLVALSGWWIARQGIPPQLSQVLPKELTVKLEEISRIGVEKAEGFWNDVLQKAEELRKNVLDADVEEGSQDQEQPADVPPEAVPQPPEAASQPPEESANHGETIYVVNVSTRLNVRSAPDVAAAVIGKLQAGETCRGTGVFTDDRRWTEVYLGESGEKGWVDSKFLSEASPS